MAQVVLLSAAARGPEEVLPSLSLLSGHHVRVATDLSALADADPHTVVVVDACVDLMAARGLCRRLATALPDLPVVAVLTDGGLTAVSAEWSVADVILTGAGPAEVDARVRLAADRGGATVPGGTEALSVDPPGELVIDSSGYSARLKGIPLDLTYKEFELLKYLVSAPGHVFTRAQILEEVWGYDYYGGTRTVDVHIRRLRAKLGPEHEGLIGTVRNVGYRYAAE